MVFFYWQEQRELWAAHAPIKIHLSLTYAANSCCLQGSFQKEACSSYRHSTSTKAIHPGTELQLHVVRKVIIHVYDSYETYLNVCFGQPHVKKPWRQTSKAKVRTKLCVRGQQSIYPFFWFTSKEDLKNKTVNACSPINFIASIHCVGKHLWSVFGGTWDVV